MKSLLIKPLISVVAISLPLLLTSCESLMSRESGNRYSAPNHRPVDIYENDRPQSAQAENQRAGRSYSITTQQGRTQRTTAAEESAEAASVPITPPSVPGSAPQLAE